MLYTVYYEVVVNDQVLKDEMEVEAVNEERAIEYCSGVLDQQYDDSVLLECRVVRKPGRPKGRKGDYERITLEIRKDLLAKIDASGKSRREYIEEMIAESGAIIV